MNIRCITAGANLIRLSIFVGINEPLLGVAACFLSIYVKLLFNLSKKMTNKIDLKLVEVTEKVKRLIYDIPKIELAEKLNISRMTLDKRLKEHSWTYKEVLIINELTK